MRKKTTGFKSVFFFFRLGLKEKKSTKEGRRSGRETYEEERGRGGKIREGGGGKGKRKEAGCMIGSRG